MSKAAFDKIREGLEEALEVSRQGMSKHTPGPWRTFNGTDVFPDDGDREGERQIADCAMSHAMSFEEEQANARLIAAAPDLLQTLKATLQKYVELAGSGDCGFWNADAETHVVEARRAIAKAEA